MNGHATKPLISIAKLQQQQKSTANQRVLQLHMNVACIECVVNIENNLHFAHVFVCMVAELEMKNMRNARKPISMLHRPHTFFYRQFYKPIISIRDQCNAMQCVLSSAKCKC